MLSKNRLRQADCRSDLSRTPSTGRIVLPFPSSTYLESEHFWIRSPLLFHSIPLPLHAMPQQLVEEEPYPEYCASAGLSAVGILLSGMRNLSLVITHISCVLGGDSETSPHTHPTRSLSEASSNACLAVVHDGSRLRSSHDRKSLFPRPRFRGSAAFKAT